MSCGSEVYGLRAEKVRVLALVWFFAEAGLMLMVEWGLFLVDCWDIDLRILSNPPSVYYFRDGFMVKRLFRSFIS